MERDNAEAGLDTKLFEVEGLSCSACAHTVESSLTGMDGVSDVKVNYGLKTARIQYDSSLVSPVAMSERLEKDGYSLHEPVSENPNLRIQAEGRQMRGRMIFALAFSLPILLTMPWHHLYWMAWVTAILSTPVVVFIGKTHYKKAWALVKRGQANMDSLVSLSVLSAYIFSLASLLFSPAGQSHVYFEAAALILAFLALGKFLENRVTERSARGLEALFTLVPSHANLVVGSTYLKVPVDTLLPGDTIGLVTGDYIPADGKLASGMLTVNEQSMTGESMPVSRSEGEALWAGTLVEEGSGTLYVTQSGSATRLARIRKQVLDAQASKAPVQIWADKLASKFSPLILVLAILTFLGWILVEGIAFWESAAVAAASVLVIACPCALGLATPLAIMAAVSRAAQQGIGIRDAAAIQHAEQIEVIAFDKTGTLTLGKPEVVQLYCVNPKEELMWKTRLVSLMTLSNHPLSQAFCAFANPVMAARLQVHEWAGRGLSSDSGFFVGNDRMLDHLEITSNPGVEAANLAIEKGHTLSWFGEGKSVSGFIAFSDTIRPEAVDVISELKEKGYRVILLSGDRAQSTAGVAAELDIQEWKSGLLPEEKAAYIEQLRESGLKVAMVGDGINDAPALAVSDLGIAMAGGTAVAMQSAALSFSEPNLQQVIPALKLSAFAMRAIRQNLYWAFGYNIVAIPMAAGLFGFFPGPALAAAAMAFSSLAVVLNSYRVYKD